MTKVWDPNHPIEFLFKQIEDATAYADHGGAPLSPVQVVIKAYTLVFQTGSLPNDCKDWTCLAAVARTWIAFKATFTLAHQEWRESQAQNAESTYGQANNIEEHTTTTANAISTLADATAANKATIIALFNAVQTLTTQLVTSQALIAASHTELAKSTPGTAGGDTGICGVKVGKKLKDLYVAI